MSLQHSKDKHYYEDYAMENLVKVGLYTKNELECKDKPDIWAETKNVGIEVVRAISNKEQQAISIVKQVCEEQKGIPKDGQLKVLARAKVKVLSDNFIDVKPQFLWTANNIVLICEAIEHKIQILNKESFRKFKTNALYIFVGQFSLNDDMVIEIVKRVPNMNGEIKYSIIYLDGIHELWVCDIEKQRFERKRIND